MPLTRAQRTAMGQSPQVYSIDKPRKPRTKKVVPSRKFGPRLPPKTTKSTAAQRRAVLKANARGARNIERHRIAEAKARARYETEEGRKAQIAFNRARGARTRSAAMAAKRSERVAENRATGIEKRRATMAAKRTARIASNRAAGVAKRQATIRSRPGHWEPHKMPNSWKIARGENARHAHAQAETRQRMRDNNGGGFQRMTGQGRYIKAFYTNSRAMATHMAPAHIPARG